MTNFQIIEDVFKNPPPQIHAYLKEIPQFPFFFYNTIPKYLRILTPLHDLITFLEGDRTPACLAYPAIQEFITRISDFIQDDDEEFDDISVLAAKLKDQLNIRLESHYGLMKLKVLYYLTPEGREDARNTTFSDLIQEPDIIHDDPQKTQYINSSSDIINYSYQILIHQKKKYIEMQQVFDNIFANATEGYVKLESDDDDYSIEDEEIEQFDETKDNNTQLAAFTQCITEIAENYYCSISDDDKMIEKYGNEMAKCFISWIIDPLPSRDLALWYGRSPYQFWTYSKNANFYEDFSDFVLRLLPTIASEAKVESCGDKESFLLLIVFR